MSKERYRRAKIAGAGRLNQADWQKLVDRAAAVNDERMASYRFDGEAPSHRTPERRVEICDRDCVPVPYHTILNVEAALAEAEMLEGELRALAESEDVSAARREKLLRTVERLRERLKTRTVSEPS